MNDKRSPGRWTRNSRENYGKILMDERGLTLVEVLVAIVVLGIVGIASTNLVLRVVSMRELAMRTEQRSLAARAAAEQVWDRFARETTSPPEQCLPSSEDPSEDPPAAHLFEPLDENEDYGFAFAFSCRKFDDEEKLFNVHVWLRRINEEDIEDEFDMLALLGGY